MPLNKRGIVKRKNVQAIGLLKKTCSYLEEVIAYSKQRVPEVTMDYCNIVNDLLDTIDRVSELKRKL